VCAGVKKANFTLEVFFAAKTHKVGITFRTIVLERGTLLRVMSSYLQKHLDTLRIRKVILFFFLSRADFNRTGKIVLESFRKQGLGLTFMFETPKQK
ncbi:unnamed protein product, partial [Ixodes persulcatus]